VLLPVTNIEGGKNFAHRIGEQIPCEVYEYPAHWLHGNDTEAGGDRSQHKRNGDAVGKVFCCRVPFWKSCMDRAGSVILIVLFFPLFLLMAVYIKAVSPGQVFYKQERVGYRGKIFTFIKFRTMHENNDPVAHREYLKELIRNGRPMQKLDADRDTRIIPRGKIIDRKSVV
jgi:lipopolysaccharide/colanic/teichoic acid biosynthesis glycosyltransferase